MDKQLAAHLKRQRRNLVIMSLVFHSVMFMLFFWMGMGGGLWTICFVPAATMVIRGYKSTKKVYNLFSDMKKAQKYYDQSKKAF